MCFSTENKNLMSPITFTADTQDYHIDWRLGVFQLHQQNYPVSLVDVSGRQIYQLGKYLTNTY